MPYEDGNPRRPKWPLYTGIGCGVGCLVAVLFVLWAIVLPIGRAYKHISTQISTPTRPVASGTYKFPYAAGAATCKVNLPDGNGSITYLHSLYDANGSIYGRGERAIRYAANGKKPVDCSLKDLQPVNLRVECYWYPKKNGKGPYLRLSDISGQSVLDVNRGVTREINQIEKQLFAGDYADDGSSIDYSLDNTKKPPLPMSVVINGAPADDVTKQFGADKGIYIGSIVRRGNLLKFVPAGGK